MNIAILNAEAGGNKGAEAMLEILIIKILEEFPEANILLEVGSKIEYYKKVFLNRFSNDNIQLLYFKPKNILKPYSVDLKNVDYAIDIGGINFHGRSLRASIRNLVRFKPFITNKVKLFFFIQDIGPSEKKLHTIIGRYILSKSEGIFTRSESSFQQVLNNFKINKKRIFGPYPDSTLIYKSDEKYELDALKESKYIVLTPSAIMFSIHGQDYLQLFVNLFDNFSTKYKVLILVHNFSLNTGSSDAILSKELHEKCPGSFFMNDNISTGNLKSILNRAVFTISSRYHVVVGSISQNVPSIAIGWNPKYESFVRLYDKHNWNIDYGVDTYNQILELTTDKNFLNSREELETHNIKLRQSVLDGFKLLFSMIK